MVSGTNIVDTGDLTHMKRKWGGEVTIWPSLLKNLLSPDMGAKLYFLRGDQALYPGFADSHAHVLGYGSSKQLSLSGASSIDEVVQRTHDYVRSHPDLSSNGWIEGYGWDQNLWPEQHYPTSESLDSPVLRDRLIVLYRVDVHALWVSPKVLELLRDSLPSEVDGGIIVRDGLGNPTGVFVDNAMALVEAIKPEWNEEQMFEFLKTTVRDAVRFGLTSIHDASTYPFMIRFFRRMADQNLLPIRLYLMAHLDDSEYWGDKIHPIADHPSGNLAMRSVKLFSDGALGSFGAALFEPYFDNNNTRGTLIYPPSTISSLIESFVANGWQTNVHCIGDRANHLVLNAFEKAINNEASVIQREFASSLGPSTSQTKHDREFFIALAGNKLRLRLEHAQIMTRGDIERAGRLGVIASIQPTHATSDMSYAEQRLGPERIRGAYAWQSLYQWVCFVSLPAKSTSHILHHSAGARLALGSDAPVESLNPLKGFYAAVTRLWPNGDSPHGPGGWYPSERLTRFQTLKAMTLNAAYASFSENKLGSLVPGKLADFVILSKDIMTVPQQEILEAKVAATVVGGKLVYGSLH
ncbi:amidohydrolase 3 [Cantharellus anzutake]|uniref:amidohydrolase 3 n=1 Tax=Cantharellus anzutake TaxID=1750568 RepID=UPI0019055B06|nr:amidohydrolase 3 [Cantharellus anzutake]KAF8335942.1 amidohydrolase 3 [Cantharellus anzutake]